MEVNRKRQRSTLQTQQPKRRLRSSNIIADIGVDCLEHVFNYFELGDLLSVAQVDKQFREAANYVFIRKYSKKKILIRLSGRRIAESPNNYDIRDEYLLLTNSKTILQVFRCFGQYVYEMKFRYDRAMRDVQRFQRIYVNSFRYINQYCADSLKTIDISPFRAEFNGLCSQPFSKIEIVKVEGLSSLPSLNRLFPKMKNLSLECRYRCNSILSLKAEHYPHLEHLEFITRKVCYHADCIGNATVVSFLKNILQMNQQLRSLIIHIHRVVFHQMDIIHLPNVEEFTIFDCGVQENPREIPFKCDKLKVLTLQYYKNKCLHTYHNFIKRHESIEKLIFNCGFELVLEDPENEFIRKFESLKTSTSLKEIIPSISNRYRYCLHGGF